MTEPKYLYTKPLIDGVIKSRPNRFIMMVETGGRMEKCHCPCTGRIGSIRFSDIPCLLSESDDDRRKTRYTVESISLDPVSKKNKSWIGIDQVKANDYIGFFIKECLLPEITGVVTTMKREVKLGDSRIDFLVNGRLLIEVKTPLKDIPCEGHPGYIDKAYKLTSFERLIRHFAETSSFISGDMKAVFILCYLYDAKPFKVLPPGEREERIVQAAKDAVEKGLEHWQVNLKLDREGISLISCNNVELFSE
jgi:sugar fermentation stimulation protein A